MPVILRRIGFVTAVLMTINGYDNTTFHGFPECVVYTNGLLITYSFMYIFLVWSYYVVQSSHSVLREPFPRRFNLIWMSTTSSFCLSVGLFGTLMTCGYNIDWYVVSLASQSLFGIILMLFVLVKSMELGRLLQGHMGSSSSAGDLADRADHSAIAKSLRRLRLFTLTAAVVGITLIVRVCFRIQHILSRTEEEERQDREAPFGERNNYNYFQTSLWETIAFSVGLLILWYVWEGRSRIAHSSSASNSKSSGSIPSAKGTLTMAARSSASSTAKSHHHHDHHHPRTCSPPSPYRSEPRPSVAITVREKDVIPQPVQHPNDTNSE